MLRSGILLLTLCLPLAADDWTHSGGDDARTRASSDGEVSILGGAWTLDVAPAKVIATPVLARGYAIVAASDGRVLAIDASDGRVAWETAMGGAVYSSPALIGDRVFVGSLNGNLSAFALADGGLLWEVPTGGQIHSSPLPVGDTLVAGVGFPEEKVVRFDALTGGTDWETGNNKVTDLVNSSAALAGSQLVIGSNGGRVYGIALATGKVDWTHDAAGATNLSSPMISGGTAYFLPGGASANLAAIDVTTGAAMAGWPLTITDPVAAPSGVLGTSHAISSPTQAGSLIVFNMRFDYALSGSHVLREYAVAVDPAGPSVAWQVALGAVTLTDANDIPELMLCPSPCALGTTVAAASSLSAQLSVISSSGGVTWTSPLSGPARSSVVAANGMLLIGTDAGMLHAFSTSGAKSPTPPAGLTPSGGQVVYTTRPVLSWIPGEGLTYEARIDGAEIATGTSAQTQVTLAAGATYGWSVRAQNGAGQWSAWSAEAEFSVAMVPSVTIDGAPYGTVADALAAAQPGEVVQLGAGTLELTSTLVIPAGVTLRGVSARDTILSAYNVTVGVELAGDGSGLELLAVEGGDTAVSATGLDVFLRHVLVANATGAGVLVDAAATGSAVNVTLVGNGTGVESAGTFSVTNAIVTENGTGLSGTVESSYNDLFDNGVAYAGVLSGIGDLAVAVAFIAPGVLDYRLPDAQPTTDRGNPMEEFTLEPEPRGDRVNLGAFGGTALAEKSLVLPHRKSSSYCSSSASGGGLPWGVLLVVGAILFALGMLRRPGGI